MNHPIEHPEAYHYAECGLPNVWLINGFERQSTPYGEGVAILDMEGLHKCISLTLCDKPEPLTGPEFKFLRRELDLSQKMMGEIFGIQSRQIRNIEKEDRIENPYNTLVRHMYLESVDPTSSLIPLPYRSTAISRCRVALGSPGVEIRWPELEMESIDRIDLPIF